MHPYGIDTNERRNLLIVLVPVSFWLSAGFLALVDLVGITLPTNLDWIFDAGSAAGWFGVLYLWLEHSGWRQSILHRIGIAHIPDLNGKWRGELLSSYVDVENGVEAFKNPFEIELEIKQRWSQIVIELRTSRSSSKSETGSIFLDSGVDPVVVYTYLNKPKPDQVESMEIHSGTTLLEFKTRDGIPTLEGHYYNGRGRGTHGTMTLSKVIEIPNPKRVWKFKRS